MIGMKQMIQEEPSEFEKSRETPKGNPEEASDLPSLEEEKAFGSKEEGDEPQKASRVKHRSQKKRLRSDQSEQSEKLQEISAFSFELKSKDVNEFQDSKEFSFEDPTPQPIDYPRVPQHLFSVNSTSLSVEKLKIHRAPPSAFQESDSSPMARDQMSSGDLVVYESPDMTKNEEMESPSKPTHSIGESPAKNEDVIEEIKEKTSQSDSVVHVDQRENCEKSEKARKREEAFNLLLNRKKNQRVFMTRKKENPGVDSPLSSHGESHRSQEPIIPQVKMIQHDGKTYQTPNQNDPSAFSKRSPEPKELQEEPKPPGNQPAKAF